MITGIVGGIIAGLIVIGFCYKFDRKPEVGGKLILDITNPEEVIYQLVIFDKTGEKMKNTKQILINVELGKVERDGEADETDSD